MEQFFKRFGTPDGVPGRAARPPVRPRRRARASSSPSDGYAVTNNHVVEKATTVEVSTDDGKTYTAKVIGTDPRTDLALIKIDGGNFPYVKLADTAPRIGDWVLAVGNPFGLGGTVTAGIVSARGRDIGAGPYDDFLQIDAPVNKGNSGGPTFNTEGSVIGVNTAIFSPSGGSVGIAFAIPAETVKTVVAQLKDKGSVTRGWIGVQIQPVTPEIADSLGLKKAARRAGRRAAEGQPGGQGRHRGRRRHRHRGRQAGAGRARPGPQDRRHGARHDRQARHHPQGRREDHVSLTLGELPNAREARAEQREQPDRRRAATRPRLGLSLAPAGSEPGVVVAEVDPSGPAADFGFKAGDVILEVAGKTVATPAEVRKALGKARAEGKRSVLMRVKSEQGTRFVAIPLGRA